MLSTYSASKKTLKNIDANGNRVYFRDGILMIRVPRRTPERIIPIQYDTRISAVQKAIQQTVQHVETEMSAEQIHQELLKENIAPLKIEKEEDAVKAASAEVIEAMTIGVAEGAGAEAGEEAGSIEGSKAARTAVEEAVAKAVVKAAEMVGLEIAGELGVQAAKATALEVGLKAGLAFAEALGASMGAEVGRIAGNVHYESILIHNYRFKHSSFS